MRKIAYCGGTFDILHAGHVAMLEWAKTEFGIVIVSLNRDEFVQRYKGRRPLMTLEERTRIMRAIRYVDAVVVNMGDEDSKVTIEAIQPDVIVNGHDWTRERLMKQMGLSESYLKETGFRIAICPVYLPIHSSDYKGTE